MAALERPVPSPEAFLGQPWAAWVREAAPSHAYCAALPHSVDLEETGKEGGKSREVMRLNKEVSILFVTTLPSFRYGNTHMRTSGYQLQAA
ncbi:Ataxin-7-like protein 1 [Chelonia mydas]|uniref:Ataxin-7-like protein 1 n=1 Tax=Chelonia mydas TaxID=8469 RepID=M7BT05_CHEMY|nr:Ataxin-7-like protein 1 [Chelonia mydas]